MTVRMAGAPEDTPLLVAIARLSTVQVRTMARFADTAGLSETQWLILAALWLDGCLTNRQIADRLQMTTGGVTPVVAQLSEKAYVERSANPVDRRSSIIALTTTGNEIVLRAWQLTRSGISPLIEEFDERERRILLRFLIGLNERVNHLINGV